MQQLGGSPGGGPLSYAGAVRGHVGGGPEVDAEAERLREEREEDEWRELMRAETRAIEALGAPTCASAPAPAEGNTRFDGGVGSVGMDKVLITVAVHSAHQWQAPGGQPTARRRGRGQSHTHSELSTKLRGAAGEGERRDDVPLCTININNRT